MKKLMAMALVIGMLSLTGCSSDAPNAATKENPKVIKAATTVPKDRSYAVALAKLAEMVDKKSGGALKVEVYNDGVLGGDRQLLEGMQMNQVQMSPIAPGSVANFAKRFDVLDLPFLFKDKQTAYKVLDGPIGTELLKDLNDVNLVGLGYWENGFRHLTNKSKEVKTIADIKGLKIRTLESKVHIDTWRTLGANPTPMAFTQLFTALEQGVVDGQENPFGNIVTSRFDEVQKNLTKTGHVYNSLVVVFSKEAWDSYTDKEKEILQSSILECRDIQRKLNEEEDQKAIEDLTKKGMKIVELNPGEKEKAQQLLEPIYQEVGQRVGGDIVDRLRAAAQ